MGNKDIYLKVQLKICQIQDTFRQFEMSAVMLSDDFQDLADEEKQLGCVFRGQIQFIIKESICIKREEKKQNFTQKTCLYSIESFPYMQITLSYL